MEPSAVEGSCSGPAGFLKLSSMGSDDREGGKGRGVGVRGLEEMRRFKIRRLKEERQPGLVVRKGGGSWGLL